MTDTNSVQIPQFQNSFTVRVRRLGIATAFIAGLVTALTLFFFLHRNAVDVSEKTFITRARVLAQISAVAVLARHDGVIAAQLDELAEEPSTIGVAFYDAHGELVLARTHKNADFPVRLEGFSLDAPQRVQREKNRISVDIPLQISWDSMEEKALGKQKGISRVNMSVGRLLFWGDPRFASDELRTLVVISAIAGGAVWLVGMLLAFVGARRVLRPFYRILRGVERFRSGDFSARIQLDTRDELGRIADSFNRLARDLSARMEELRQWKEHLEREVAEKTQEIRNTSLFLHELIAPVEGQGDVAWVDLLERLCRDSRSDAVVLHVPHGQGGFSAFAAYPTSVVEKLQARVFDGEMQKEQVPGSDKEIRRFNLRNPDGLGGQLVLLGPPDVSEPYLEQVIPALTITLANARAFVSVRELAARLERQNEILRNQKRELETQKAELELANRLKSQFVANVSHELRTPLNAIIGYSGMLAEGLYGPVNESQLDSIRAVEESGRNLLNLINTILDHSRLEADKMPVYPEKIEDLRKVIQETVSRNQPLTRERSYEIDAELPPFPVPCFSDVGKIQQIVTNLISNAVKFTEQGFVKVTLEPRGDFLDIAVRDTGCGIPEAEFENIFQEFRQVDGSATRAAGGTGLGLSVSRRLAQLLGGTMSVQSRVGEGSTFTLHIPRRLQTGEEKAS